MANTEHKPEIAPADRESNRGRPGRRYRRLAPRLGVAGVASLGLAVALPLAARLVAPAPAAPAPGTRFLPRPEGRIAYDDEGSGPLVVLVPGLGDLRAEYRFLKPELLRAGYRVVSVDVRGHGESDTTFADYSTSAVGSDVVALLGHLGAGPAFLVGTSMGAGAIAWAAAEAPDLVRGLVLVGPFVREIEPAGLRKSATRALYRALFARPWGPLVWGAYYAGTLYPTQKPPDLASYRATLQSNLTEKGRLEALATMITLSKADVEARLGEVRAPVLVMMGTRDSDFKDPVAEANLVAERLGGRVAMVEGAGHYPHVEMPDKAAPLVLAFLGSRSEQA